MTNFPLRKINVNSGGKKEIKREIKIWSVVKVLRGVAKGLSNLTDIFIKPGPSILGLTWPATRCSRWNHVLTQHRAMFTDWTNFFSPGPTLGYVSKSYRSSRCGESYVPWTVAVDVEGPIQKPLVNNKEQLLPPSRICWYCFDIYVI